MNCEIGIVGCGPTGLYTLAELIRCPQPLTITIFDKGEWAGAGTPYSRDGANRLMLANIASIEIPPLTQTFLQWMQGCEPRILESYGITQDMLNDRLFAPRLLLGCYLHDELLELIRIGREQGHTIRLVERLEVVDIVAEGTRFRVDTAEGRHAQRFDKLILATGHDFEPTQDDDHYFANPWTGLIGTEVPACKIGILGTSLSAIDAALAVVCQHGQFEWDKEDLRFTLENPGLTITMMSRNGLLPEADFYCPIPYLPLERMTEPALEDCVQQTEALDAVFSLFRDELALADPAYAAKTDLHHLSADSFADAYFAERAESDPFRWARKNLNEVVRNKEHRITVPWRYAILRMHEPVETIVAQLSEEDRVRFDRGLKRVFVDNYAAVPPESIRRLLALRDAGILKVQTLSEDYEIVKGSETTMISSPEGSDEFDVFIDATGQKPQTVEDIRFPSLRRALQEDGQTIPRLHKSFALRAPEPFAGNLYFGAIPFLMHNRPFVQGIVASKELGEIMSLDIIQHVEAEEQTEQLCA
ncbi:FAD/NAD(P)-binding protein [Rhizobium sp. C4]|uniref:FAD/NAD(P)-binding protein n=1 Tax=Rhizobium sp. C4 TaxID=1349800 RepID=UPI001E4A076E|nr:FAD/NAD(P)-binding protein [Rhizobium sp. C4]MCD2172425.1 FAD/NAD(P)-binding protein [Rhizobium sp. C4]